LEKQLARYCYPANVSLELISIHCSIRLFISILRPPDTVFLLQVRVVVHFELNINTLIRVCDKFVTHLMHLWQFCELTYVSLPVCDGCVNWLMSLMHSFSCRQKLLLFCIWSLLVFFFFFDRFQDSFLLCVIPALDHLQLL
jgi:hypothetical protein